MSKFKQRYSNPDQFRIVSYLTLICMAYLSNEEFTVPERNHKLGTLLWPDWFNILKKVNIFINDV